MKKVDLQHVAKLARQGLGARQIAERLGVTRNAIYRACQVAGTTFSDLAAQPK